MKNFLVTFLAISCVALLIIGKLHWENKTAVSAVKENTGVTVKTEPEKTDTANLQEKAANWPEIAQEQYKQALAEGRTFTILLAGSQALGTEENDLSSLVKKEIESTYDGTIEVIVKPYEVTSAEFVAQGLQAELIAANPDMTLLEPFTLNDNGMVAVEYSHQYISQIAADLTTANPNHILLLQPSYPLHQASFYPEEVRALKAYAEQEGLPYLDHWIAWPDQNSDEILEYLNKTNESTTANEKGKRVWAEFLMDYFISEK